MYSPLVLQDKTSPAEQTECHKLYTVTTVRITVIENIHSKITK